MKILLRDFNAKVGWENIFKLTIGNEGLHQDSNDNDDRIVNFATSKNPVVKSTMFPHWNYTWTSPDGKTHNQIDNILIDRRWQWSILDGRSFRGADCDTHHYLVVAKFGKIGSKSTSSTAVLETNSKLKNTRDLPAST